APAGSPKSSRKPPRASACWLAEGRYTRCLPGEHRSPYEGAPTARRENSVAAVRELAGSAGGPLAGPASPARQCDSVAVVRELAGSVGSIWRGGPGPRKLTEDLPETAGCHRAPARWPKAPHAGRPAQVNEAELWPTRLAG